MAAIVRVADAAGVARVRTVHVVAALVVAALAVAPLVVAGCGPAPGNGTPRPSTTPGTQSVAATVAPTEAAGAGPSQRPSASPAPTIPLELRGKWQAVLAPGDVATLEIGLGSYTISRVGRGSGGVRTIGDEIDLFGSDLCPGLGRYRWSADATSLRLDAIEPDPCAGRADALAGRTFTRLP